MPRDQLHWIADTKADKTTADVFVTQVGGGRLQLSQSNMIERKIPLQTSPSCTVPNTKGGC